MAISRYEVMAAAESDADLAMSAADERQAMCDDATYAAWLDEQFERYGQATAIEGGPWAQGVK